MPFSACTRDVSLDTMEKRQVVVDCVLTNGHEQTLYLCFGQGTSEDTLHTITDADVTLTDLSEGKVVGTFDNNHDGSWTLPYAALSGHSYRLEVSVPGYELVYAEQTMPLIDVFAHYYSLLEADSSFYEYISWPYIIYRLNSLPDYTWIYALTYDETTGTRKIADNICTDFPYVDNFNLTGSVYSPEVHTDKRGNGYALAPDLIGKSLHNRYLRIPHPADLDKMWLIVSGDFSGEYNFEFKVANKEASGLKNDGKISELGEKQGCIVFVGVSEDYDRFLLESIHYHQLQESSDLSSIYMRDNIYTNIHGGIGIFGAKSEEMMVWCDKEGVIL